MWRGKRVDTRHAMRVRPTGGLRDGRGRRAIRARQAVGDRTRLAQAPGRRWGARDIGGRGWGGGRCLEYGMREDGVHGHAGSALYVEGVRVRRRKRRRGAVFRVLTGRSGGGHLAMSSDGALCAIEGKPGEGTNARTHPTRYIGFPCWLTNAVIAHGERTSFPTPRYWSYLRLSSLAAAPEDVSTKEPSAGWY